MNDRRKKKFGGKNFYFMYGAHDMYKDDENVFLVNIFFNQSPLHQITKSDITASICLIITNLNLNRTFSCPLQNLTNKMLKSGSILEVCFSDRK